MIARKIVDEMNLPFADMYEFFDVQSTENAETGEVVNVLISVDKQSKQDLTVRRDGYQEQINIIQEKLDAIDECDKNVTVENKSGKVSMKPSPIKELPSDGISEKQQLGDISDGAR